MSVKGTYNKNYAVEKFGFKDLGDVAYNLEAPALYEESMRRGEAMLVAGGAINAETGIHTGRSPKDKFTVLNEATDGKVWWDNNNQMSQANFDLLLEDFIEHARGRDMFVQDLFGGADLTHRISVRIVTEYLSRTWLVDFWGMPLGWSIMILKPRLAESPGTSIFF